jgi:DNA-binding response OmpR family regulator
MTPTDVALRIGIIEDNDDLRDSLVQVLSEHGHFATGFASAEDFDEQMHGLKLDLLLLDLNLPGEDGLSVAARLRPTQKALRIIMMTTRTAVGDRISGYDAGADIYLSKPISEDELLAAVRAAGRQLRASVISTAEEIDRTLYLDWSAMELRGAKGVVSLSPVEISLLVALARASGHQLAHWQLIDILGLEVNEVNRANLSVRLSRLRNKLNQISGVQGALKPLRSQGYQLCVPLEIR